MMIVNELMNRSIEYIIQNLDEEISIEDVANHCYFSKYYFSRVFKSEIGESVYAFIKRFKMDQSAIRLKLEKGKSITDIGVEYGYSLSNYSTAFKKHYHISPERYRKHTNDLYVRHPYDINKLARFQSFEEYDEQILIGELDDFTVICERHIGNYTKLGENWQSFIEIHNKYFKEDTLLLERFFDDPTITNVDKCLYDICMTVDKNCPLENLTTISGGKFAFYRFDGLVKDIFTAFQGVFAIWLPHSGYEMGKGYGLDIYHAIDREKMHVVIDLCIPIIKK